MNWTILSIETLKRVKSEMMIYVEDVAKDMRNKDTRIVMAEVLMQLNEIDDAIEALGDKRSTSN